jgi:hypothetical protein
LLDTVVVDLFMQTSGAPGWAFRQTSTPVYSHVGTAATYVFLATLVAVEILRGSRIAGIGVLLILVAAVPIGAMRR